MKLEQWLREKAQALLEQEWRDRESVVEHFEHDRGNLLVPSDVTGDPSEEEVRAAYDSVIEAVKAGEV